MPKSEFKINIPPTLDVSKNALVDEKYALHATNRFHNKSKNKVFFHILPFLTAWVKSLQRSSSGPLGI